MCTEEHALVFFLLKVCFSDQILKVSVFFRHKSMGSQVQFKALEEYALSHTRFSAPADTEDDFIDQYISVLNKDSFVILYVPLVC